MIISYIVGIFIVAWLLGLLGRWIFGWTMKSSLMVSGAIALGLAISYGGSTGTFSLGKGILWFLAICLIYRLVKWLLTKSPAATFLKGKVKAAAQALSWPQRGLVIAIAAVVIVILVII